jgi:hypothetical protein
VTQDSLAQVVSVRFDEDQKGAFIFNVRSYPVKAGPGGHLSGITVLLLQSWSKSQAAILDKCHL